MIGLLGFSQSLKSQILLAIDIFIVCGTGFCKKVVYACINAAVRRIRLFDVDAEGLIIEPFTDGKGGNLAVYACVNCANSLQTSIKSVDTFDAPGFPLWFFAPVRA